MKIVLLLPGLFFGVLFLSPTDSSAQWQPDVPLTNDPALSQTSYNNARCVAASDNVVQVVWTDYRDGNSEIYYKRSIDGGSSWGPDTRITNNSADSYFPSVSVSGQVVHVAWADLRDGNNEIYYKRSMDGGTSWGADTRLTIDLAFSGYPSVSVSDSAVHIVWVDGRDLHSEIYYKRSTDGGVSWEADRRLTFNSANRDFASVAVSGQVVHVAWADLRDGNNEIYYKRSMDGGTSWGADTRLTNHSGQSWYSSVSVSGLVVHVVWRDDRDGNNEIYYKRSIDGGISWETDTRLTNDPAHSLNPTVSVSGQGVHVVWTDYRDGNEEIYYKRSINGGVSWGADTRLTNNANASEFPSIAVSGQAVHVVWRDNRDGNYEIYYKRDPTGNTTDVRRVDDVVVIEYKLFQNFPNPFNPSTQIDFSLPLSGFVTLKVFSILGEEVATLVSQEFSVGHYSTRWIADREASGVYYYRLQIRPSDAGQTGLFVETKKLILLR